MNHTFVRFALFATSLTLPASALIVAGASGGGNTTNNTTQAQLQSELSTSFPAYGNVIQYSDASAVYLGYNAATNDVWVLTALHITANATAGSTVVIDGLVYNRQPDGDGYGYTVGGDLRLVRYTRADSAVPSLPAVKLGSTVPAASSQLIMIGYGQNRVQNAATNAFTSDAVSTGVGTGYGWSGTNIERWGTNNVEAEFANSLESGVPVSGVTGTFSMGSYNTVGFMTDFDQPASGGYLTSNEAQGSLGDSGGGAFTKEGGEWVLSGIFSAIAGYTGQTANTSAFGNYTLITDVSTYKPAIEAAMGGVTLVPEPASAGLLLLSGLGLLARRRRALV